ARKPPNPCSALRRPTLHLFLIHKYCWGYFLEITANCYILQKRNKGNFKCDCFLPSTFSLSTIASEF
ncbi:unnamed protein product, partial [Musa hybrid cultivar]